VKLLFDENLPPRLVRLLADVYPGCSHVHSLGMDTASDSEIWAYAAETGYTIVSKDADFQQRSVVMGAPPKVVWLRMGNCSVAQVATLLRERFISIGYFHENADSAILVLGI
jgi:predicted nuclease of predicted toxin-antitoxin system